MTAPRGHFTVFMVRILFFQAVSVRRVGYDTLVAKLLFRLRETELPDIKVILVFPPPILHLNN